MTANPLVSVIVIFLNGEKFIEETIASIFAQTYLNWELLLVDDGSTDGSTEIAQRYAKQFPQKVRYLEHPAHQNRGMSAARNLGIQNARGEYIAFLDADDIWLPAKLEEQVALMQAHPEAAIIYGRTLIWYSWTGRPEHIPLDHTLDLGVQPNTLVKPPALFFLLLQNKVQSPTTCNAMVRRETFDAVGTFEEKFRGMYEDQAFFAKVELKAPVFVADACWAKYRQHPDSCSNLSVNGQDYFTTRLPFIQWLADYVSKEGDSQPGEVWRALEKELWNCHHPYIAGLIHQARLRVWQFKNLLKFLGQRLGSILSSSSTQGQRS